MFSDAGFLIVLQRLMWPAFLAGLLVISGCQSVGTLPPASDTTSPDTKITESPSITEIIANNTPEAAMALLENTAAGSSDETALPYLLKVVELATLIESASQVNQRLRSLKQRYTSPDYQIDLTLLELHIALHRRQAQQVLAALSRMPDNLSQPRKIQVSGLKARALGMAEFPLESTRVRISLDSLLQNSVAKQKNDEALWANLMQTGLSTISGQISEIPDTYSGWLELAVIAHQHTGTAFNQALDQWVTRNKEHPANRYIIDTLRVRALTTDKFPGHIALLLPLTGKLSAIGKAIRNGFMSAYFNDNLLAASDTQITVHDTAGNAETAVLAVRQANASGVEFIVGPLDKNAVQAVSQVADNQIPLLLLNQANQHILQDTTSHLDASGQTGSARQFQFALSPEIEAKQAAEKAIADGHLFAMTLVSSNAWGNRLYEAFTQHYENMGGKIVAHASFRKGETNFSDPIQKGLNLLSSKLRHQKIKSLISPGIKFTPRRRQDVDVIFLVAQPKEARLIKPQLRFYYADDIPVYATSHIFTGYPQPELDQDLENIHYPDMPWVLQDKPAPGSIEKILRTQWPQEARYYNRFHALGADSFRLIPYLDWLQQHKYDSLNGGTGRLTVNAEGMVNRQSSWASFKNGIPVTQDSQ